MNNKIKDGEKHVHLDYVRQEIAKEGYTTKGRYLNLNGVLYVSSKYI